MTDWPSVEEPDDPDAPPEELSDYWDLTDGADLREEHDDDEGH